MHERSVAESDARPRPLSDAPGLQIDGNGHNGLGLFNDAPMYDYMQKQRIFVSLSVCFKIQDAPWTFLIAALLSADKGTLVYKMYYVT